MLQLESYSGLIGEQTLREYDTNMRPDDTINGHFLRMTLILERMNGRILENK